MTKYQSIIVPALCAAVMLLVSCIELDFNNPLDPANGGMMVTYDINGGFGTVPPAKLGARTIPVTLADGSGFARGGFTFGGWNTNAAGTGSNYNAGDRYTPARDVTLYARWSTVTGCTDWSDWNVTTAASCDAAGEETKTCLAGAAGTETQVIPQLTGEQCVTGCTQWSDWYVTTAASCDAAGEETKTCLAGAAGTETQVIPQLTGEQCVTVNTYTITFDPQSGSVSPASGVTGTNGRLTSLPTPSRGGYTFDGWFTAASGGTEVTVNTVFSTNSSIYAQWTINHVVTPVGSFTETGGGLNFEMIAVEGGEFTMGCTAEQGSDCWSDESPTSKVTLSSFHIGKFVVTQKLWGQVMGNTTALSSCGSYGVGDDHPMYCVSWNMIVNDFLPALNALTGKTYRLPTEAEWEYAARGGKSSNGTKYSGSNTLDDVAWHSGNSGGGTKPVGTKAANELGIYDMSGNVWEWVHDWYGSYSDADKIDPEGPTSGSYRVFRGGSWLGGVARGFRVSGSRSDSRPDSGFNYLGFRLAVSSSP